jgi:hypothetical protein
MDQEMFVVWKKVYIDKERSLLHDWHGKIVGKAGWAELSAKYAKKRRVKFNEWKIWTEGTE